MTRTSYLPPAQSWTDADLDVVLDGLRENRWYESLDAATGKIEGGHYNPFRQSPDRQAMNLMSNVNVGGWGVWPHAVQAEYIRREELVDVQLRWIREMADAERDAFYAALTERARQRNPEWDKVITWLERVAVGELGEHARGFKMIANLPLSTSQMDQLAKQCQWCGMYAQVKRQAIAEGIIDEVRRLAPEPVDDRYRAQPEQPPQPDPRIDVRFETIRTQDTNAVQAMINQMRQYATRLGTTPQYNIIDESFTWAAPPEPVESTQRLIEWIWTHPEEYRQRWITGTTSD
jgi:hypothetical protein